MKKSPDSVSLRDAQDRDARMGLWWLIQVPPPAWLPLPIEYALVVLGLMAFAVTGFSDDRFSPSWLSGQVFSYPIALFAWLVILLCVLQILMMRMPSPESGLAATPLNWASALGAFVASGVIIALAARFSGFAQAFGQATSQSFDTIYHGICFAINLYLVGGLLYVAIREGMAALNRRLRHRAETGVERRTAAGFFSAAVFAIIFAFASSTQVLAFVAQALQQQTIAHSCTVSLLASCERYPQPMFIETWTGFDILQAIVYLMVGLMIAGFDFLRQGGKGGIQAEEEELNELIRHSFPARLLRQVGELIHPLRHPLAWGFVLASVFAELGAAKLFQRYLRLLSAEHEAGLSFQVRLQNYRFLPAAVALAVVPVMFMALVVALTLWPRHTSFWRIFKYWAGGLVQLSVVALLPVSLFSLVLSLLNLVLYLFLSHAVPRPFLPPGLATIIPFAMYCILAILIQKRRLYGTMASRRDPTPRARS